MSNSETDHHLTEALDHLRKARSGEFEDEHVAESVDNAITETIVARGRRSLPPETEQ